MKLVEAAGVELFRVLIPRNLLILRNATTAKKAPLPDPLYVYCTKMLFAFGIRGDHFAIAVFHRIAEKQSTFYDHRPFTAQTRVQIPPGTPIQYLTEELFYSLFNERIGNYGFPRDSGTIGPAGRSRRALIN
jgi:hypothetical protein